VATLAWLLHLVGGLAALHAFLRSSTPQGAVAWSLALLFFPLPVLPIYLIFGSTHFSGYVEIARTGRLDFRDEKLLRALQAFEGLVTLPPPARQPGFQSLAGLFRLPLVGRCSLDLLIDGQQAYAQMLQEIENAQDYLLVLFYKVENDGIGRRLQQALLAKAREGIRVYFVFDEMGSARLGSAFVKQLRQAGAKVWSFRTARGWRHRLQWNFRNHRKIIVADGRVALVGGLNVADKYLGLNPKVGPWRDTHVCLRGPAVMAVQLVFVEDYYWASGGGLPEVDWVPQVEPAGENACTYLGFGPADSLPKGLLFYLACISQARHRLWLASPYFVPDASLVHALRLAAMRGVDVRVLIPPGRFERWMRLAALPFLRELAGAGVQFWEYSGYNHSKLMLVDDWLSWVGSSNLDNRSLRLNFEGNLVVVGQAFAAQVEAMLTTDLGRSRLISPAELRSARGLSRILAPCIRVVAPLL